MGFETSKATIPFAIDSLAIAGGPDRSAKATDATALMIQGVRQGQISVDDIIDRYGQKAQAEKKARIQLLDELVSPEAIATRKAQLLADLSKAEQGKATSEALKPVAPIAGQLATTQATQQLNLAKHPGADLFYKLAVPLGVTVPVDDTTGEPDYARMAAIGSKLASAQSQKIAATEKLAAMEKHITKDGTAVIFSLYGNPVKPEEHKRLTELANQDLFTAAGLLPGQGTPTTAPSIAVAPSGNSSPVTPSPQQLFDPKTMAPGQTITVTAPSAPPPGTPMTDVAGFSLGSAAAADRVKAPTEAQQRAQLALTRFTESGDLMSAVKEAGYDPTSTTAWVQSFLPEILKTGNQKMFDQAVRTFSQGLLRLESGAAISRREESWYREAFFPQVNDPPAVVEAKNQLRAQTALMTAEIAQQGGVVSPESAKAASELYKQADQLAVKKTSAAAPASSGAGVIKVLPKLGRVRLNPDGTMTRL